MTHLVHPRGRGKRVRCGYEYENKSVARVRGVGRIVTARVSDERELATIEDLLRALGYELAEPSSPADDLEDYVLGYLVEDLGMNLFVNLDDDSFDLIARMSFYTDDAVNMWSLSFPTTLNQFHRYLDELDIRVARLRAIVDLPAEGDLRDPDESELPIVEALARLLQTTKTHVLGELGDDWVPIDSEAKGLATQPVRFMAWAGKLVIGLDDEYLHLFRLEWSDGKPDVGDAIACFEFGNEGTMSLDDLSTILQRPIESS
jgi:hypothetical protein